jgi:CubicO group peptidase (beta-lactamase class C family)
MLDEIRVAESGSPRQAVGALIAAVEAEQIDLHSILVMHKGAVAAETYRAPFDAKTPHRMYSVTKSFTSTAIGLCVAEGRLTVEDRVVDLFPELVPADADAHRDALKVKHLLTMSSGHLQPVSSALARPVPSIAGFIADKPTVPPGSRFDYSNYCSYTLAAIVERLTGETVGQYLRPRLLDPLGIELRDWLRSEEGVTNGGWGLHLTTREVARFGQFLLQRGEWEGRQLVPASWIDEATGRRVASWGNAGMQDWTHGYGYQFWQCPHDGYRADGLMGQLCIVLPKLDAVVMTTAGTMRTQRLLDLIWENVLPALTSPSGDTANEPAFSDEPAGAADSPNADKLGGVTFRFGEPFVVPTRLYGGQAPIVGAGIELSGDTPAVVLTDRNARYRLPVGMNSWAGGVSPVSTAYPEPYRGFLRWESETSLVTELVFTEAGFRLRLAFNTAPLQLVAVLPANPGLESRSLIGRPFP